MYLTNFKNSYIGWDDTSSGRFNLVSILKIKYKRLFLKAFNSPLKL